MEKLQFRGNIEKLPYCPRCEVTCGCGGHRVAQSSQAVHRSFFDGYFIDMGFWCWCCFSQTWNLLSLDTRQWLDEIAQVPDSWQSSAARTSSIDLVQADWEQACTSLKFGCEWKSLADESNMKLVAAPQVGDLPFAQEAPSSHFVAVSSGVSRLIKRAVAKDERALRRK